ncbi:MAG: hypothetical protein ACR5LD_02495 [Symbiopectobacterium sp.]
MLNALRLLAEQHELPGWRCLISALADDISEGESFLMSCATTRRWFPRLYPPWSLLGR